MVGEYDAAGASKKGYGWRPDGIWGTNPVFMAEGGKYYFYHNDHLGTPQKMTDASGNTVWSAAFTAFGEAAVDPASTVVNNLRFPGQYFDGETGLHYNWMRSYDQVIGRYTQTDPIKFAGDHANQYVFSFNSPVNFFDESGLTGPISTVTPGASLCINAGTCHYNPNKHSLPVLYDSCCVGKCLGKVAVNKGVRAFVDGLTGVTGLIPIDINIITDKGEDVFESSVVTSIADAADKYAENQANKMMPERSRYLDLVSRTNSHKRQKSTNLRYGKNLAHQNSKLKTLKKVPIAASIVMTAEIFMKIEDCLRRCRR